MQILSQVRKSSLLSHDLTSREAVPVAISLRRVLPALEMTMREGRVRKTSHGLSGRRQHWYFLSPQTHFCPQPSVLLNTLSSSNVPLLRLPPSLSPPCSSFYFNLLSTGQHLPVWGIYHKTQFLASGDSQLCCVPQYVDLPKPFGHHLRSHSRFFAQVRTCVRSGPSVQQLEHKAGIAVCCPGLWGGLRELLHRKHKRL